MFYSRYQNPSLKANMHTSFAGLNKNARIGENEFSDMKNMSSDRFPLLSVRKGRVTVQKQAEGTALNGILGDVGFAAVWGGEFYYMGEKIEGIALADSEKNLVAFGADILIFPDGVYYNTVTGECGNIAENEKVNKQNYIEAYDAFDIPDSTMLACNINHKWDKTTKTSVRFLSSEDSTNVWIVKDCPSSVELRCSMYNEHSELCAIIGTKDGFVYYCSAANVTRTKINGYFTYHYEDCEWTKVDISYFKLTSAQFGGLGFDDNDLDKIWCGDVKVKIEKDGDNYLVKNKNIADAIDLRRISYYGTTGFTGSHDHDNIGSGLRNKGTWRVRTIPILDFVCVQDNRLFGCRYGMQVSSDSEKESVNEIYVSALGDFRTWTLSEDNSVIADAAYTASVGDFGPFTGCISHRGYVLFFKEDVIYRLSGNKPANYQITKVSAEGVQKGSEKSLKIIDGVLFYKAKNGVYAYDGSLPAKVSSSLGDLYYTDAVAGGLLSKYYISMVHEGKRKLYVFDTSNGLWHAEDDADVRFFAEYDGALYGGVGNCIVCFSGTASELFKEIEPEGDFEWYAESGDIGLSQPFEKYFHRLLVRMDIECGARVRIEIAADGGDFLLSGDYTAPGRQSVTLPVVTPRCDRMRVRISGKGSAKIYSMYYEIESTR